MVRPLLVVLCLVLAGCSGSAPANPAEEPTGEEEPYDGRMSRGGAGGSRYDDVPHKDVLVFESEVMALGPTDLSFDVVVPRGLLRIAYKITSEQMLQRDAFWIELEGCGSDGTPGFAGTYNPTAAVTVGSPLCDDPASGTRSLRITGGPATYIDGKVELTGWEPLAGQNATKE